MKRILMSAAAVVVVLGLSNAAWAGGKGSNFKGSSPKFVPQIHNNFQNNNHNNNFHNNNFKPQVIVKPLVKPAFVNSGFNKVPVANYCQNYGVKCSYGYCYKGNVHCHWSSQCYSPQYCCQVYYCPSASCWYWWCAADNCYYPVSYCPHGVYH